MSKKGQQSVITFELVDEDGDKSKYVAIGEMESSLSEMKNKDVVVINKSKIMVFYQYPFMNGPDKVKGYGQGYIIEEVAPNGKSFTRAELVTIVCDTYAQMYSEMNEDDFYDTFADQYDWIDVLLWDSVSYIKDQDVYVLGISH